MGGLEATPEALMGIFDLLPYPFLLSKRSGDSWVHAFANKQFTAELGYTLEDIPTIDEWFLKAYPDATYRSQICNDWNVLAKSALESESRKVVMRVVVQTKTGPKWFEVTNTILENLIIVAFINIHELKTHELKLQQENLNRDKILSILSHDLRGPIANLVSLTKLFQQDRLSNEELSKVMTNMSRDVNHTYDLLETTLTWTKSNFNKLENNRNRVNIRNVIHGVLYLVMSDLKNKRLDLDLSVAPDYINTDSGILSIVMRNLISNAIKFSVAGGKIVVRTEKNDDTICIRVQDFGMGMNAEAIGFILSDQPFSKAGTFREQGFGLGLRLCREFLPLIEGAMTIESKEQQGTTMTIKLPLT